jgi:uncharacterized protein (TIGR02996 family)
MTPIAVDGGLHNSAGGPQTHAEHLRAILVDPANDGLRREYARWLAGQGDAARARFVAVQLRLDELRARSDPDAFDLTPAELDEFVRLEREERTLLAGSVLAWSGAAQSDIAGLTGVKFRRGFPHDVRLIARAFPATADTLFRVLPTIRELTLELAPGDSAADLAEPVFAEAALSRLDALSLRGPWGPAAASAIVASPHLRGLKLLDLSGCGLGPTAVSKLLTASGLASLTDLDLSDNPLGADGALLISLADCWPTALRSLDLTGTNLHDGAATFLATGPAIAGLRELVLADNPLTADGIDDLLAAPALTGIVLRFDSVLLSNAALENRIEHHNRMARDRHR